MRRVRQQYFTTLINSCSKISTNDLLAHMNFMSDPQKTGMNIFNTQYTVHVRWLVAMYSLLLNKAVLLKRFYVPSKIKQSHRKGKKKNGAVRECLQTLAVIILIIHNKNKQKKKQETAQTDWTNKVIFRSLLKVFIQLEISIRSSFLFKLSIYSGCFGWMGLVWAYKSKHENMGTQRFDDGRGGRGRGGSSV